MARPNPARTSIARAGHARALEVRLDLAQTVVEARRDGGLSARQLARAAGVSTETVLDLESARRDAGLEVMARISAALGGRLRVWHEPGTGVAVHDRYQAAMVGALVRGLGPDWRAALEVGVKDPVNGVIDAVLERRIRDELVAAESESGLRRIEQQVRWAAAKADALASARMVGGRPVTVSRLLLLRSTAATRAVAATYADVLALAYPCPMADALAALTTAAPWPGAAIVWCSVNGSTATLLDRPPRGIRVGR